MIRLRVLFDSFPLRSGNLPAARVWFLLKTAQILTVDEALQVIFDRFDVEYVSTKDVVVYLEDSIVPGSEETQLFRDGDLLRIKYVGAETAKGYAAVGSKRRKLGDDKRAESSSSSSSESSSSDDQEDSSSDSDSKSSSSASSSGSSSSESQSNSPTSKSLNSTPSGMHPRPSISNTTTPRYSQLPNPVFSGSPTPAQSSNLPASSDGVGAASNTSNHTKAQQKQLVAQKKQQERAPQVESLENNVSPNAADAAFEQSGHVVFDEEGNVVESGVAPDEPLLDVIPSWMKQRPPHKNVNYKKLERRRSTRKEKRQTKRAFQRAESGQNQESTNMDTGNNDYRAVPAPESVLVAEPANTDSRPTISASELLEGDSIACKFLELDPVKWTPTISDWKFGVVLAVNADSKTLRLQIDNNSGHSSSTPVYRGPDDAEELDDASRVRYQFMASLNQVDNSSPYSELDLNFGEIFEAKILSRKM